MIRAALLAIALAISGAALAANPSEMLDDPALEARARDISAELRCLVCQNQSIDDSDAALARDLRVLVRERLAAGDTNDEVFAYVTDRYGDFVLLRPPFNAATVLLWVLPFVVVAVGLVAGGLYMRRRQAAPVVALSPEEEAALAKLLADRGRSSPTG